ARRRFPRAMRSPCTDSAEADALVAKEWYGIGEHAVHAHHEVQVAAGRAAGRADLRDQLPGADLLPDVHPDAAGRDVRVPGADAAGVLDLDEVAEVARPARVDHGAEVRRADGGAAALPGEVDAGVQPPVSVDRMQPIAELARDVAGGGARPSGRAQFAARPAAPLGRDPGVVVGDH